MRTRREKPKLRFADVTLPAFYITYGRIMAFYHFIKTSAIKFYFCLCEINFPAAAIRAGGILGGRRWWLGLNRNWNVNRAAEVKRTVKMVYWSGATGRKFARQAFCLTTTCGSIGLTNVQPMSQTVPAIRLKIKSNRRRAVAFLFFYSYKCLCVLCEWREYP